MKHLKLALFFLILIFQQVIILCAAPSGFTELTTTEEVSLASLSSSVSNKYYFEKPAAGGDQILHITSKTNMPAYPGYLYASFTDTISEGNRIFSSQNRDTNELYIDLSKHESDEDQSSSFKGVRILLSVPNVASNTITLKAELIQKIVLESSTSTENNKKAKINIPEFTQVTYKVPNPITFGKVLIYGLGESCNVFSMALSYGSGQTIEVNPIFENGYGSIIKLGTGGIAAGTEITIAFSHKTGFTKSIVEVGFEVVDQVKNHIRKVNILEHVYGATEESENCYEITEDVPITRNPVLLINAFSQAVSFWVKKKSDDTKQYSQDGLHNSFIRLLDSFNNTNYFCIKKYTPKYEETEQLGKSSYDFQLYYEDDLPNIQMFIMPLINGKIYTHSLNRDSIMVYRHNFYSGGSIYSANLLKIRGNPVLYGYPCNNYPNCPVTTSTTGLESIQKINQYFINKRSGALGNTARNTNGEPVSDLKEQYMSVVKCETVNTDPNDGECKFTIEINNEGDEIQLLPERVFTTSILTGSQKFYVRISNFETVNKLNITLTILTGNAYMKVYSDSDRAASKEITAYNHHKVFRREVFEFINETDNPVAGNYYGVITCTEPSFIELSYKTSFHFKGYIMTNPGEVNIEYINKKGSQFPYEILNPYIYIPLNTAANLAKNKDYMFKIRSTECTMFYNYNYNNMPNTKSVNMQFDKTQPYTYLTSFAFMTTVDNYNFNSAPESTDCAMLVYSGEIDSSERPLLIVSDVPLPTDFEKTYFIYPYIYNTEFQGIMIDIKYPDNYEGSLSYDIGLTVKITNDVHSVQTITSSTSIYISKDNAALNCGNNIQCSLTIAIEKKEQLTKAHQITVNVYSPKPSVPEIIERTTTSGEFNIQKDGYKLIQVSIGLFEGIEFQFDFMTLTGAVSAKLLSKESFNKINNFNNFESLQGVSIPYDATEKKLKLNSQSEICAEGCTLLMKISLNSAVNNVNKVTFTQREIPYTLDLSPSFTKKITIPYNIDGTNNIFSLSVTPKEYAFPGFIYASFDENVSQDNRLFSSQEPGINKLDIDLSKYPDKKQLYISIVAPKQVTTNSNTVYLKGSLASRVELSDTNPKAKFKLSQISEVYYKVPSETYSSILLYALGGEWKYFEMKATYETSSGTIRNLNVKPMFDNGYGVVVQLNKVGKDNEIKITVTPKLESDKERKIEVGFELADQEIDHIRQVNILEHVYGATAESENCYTMTENVNINKHPVLLINAFSQAVSFVVRKKSAHSRIYSQDGLHNSFIRLLQSFDKDNHYFCIKKYTPKDRTTEELGDSSYDFQLYYEDDLPSNQMLIMPLINGHIYTHSLNRGSVMVYRNSNFASNSNSNTNKIYSANLLKIRGNPKLYGYTCNTYPNCPVTKTTSGLEAIGVMNQYSINKRENAEGNTAIDTNGEGVSELRKQYLSVVICDTEDSDPNYGECKYTIEINNEKDYIQLVPERVFATSLLPGINYFSVRVSNYQDIKKMNISLTVLTGNAYMNIFEDFEERIKITDYKYHKVFRKEVFEFSGSNMREIYWGEINCTEPAFIELSYKTSFHFKGYIMTNPGEVNIEYINKKGSQFPYEILNPYIYIPLNENLAKNKDYMFKIRSTECTMFYNYNYNNMPNTKSVNMQFDKTQPYTYLTSFAFMTTVDNYTYNTRDDSTDCAMLVYSGEIDSPERPLLILSDFPLPSDFDNTYYVYPYIQKGFKGLKVEIKFTDSNLVSPSYIVKLRVNGQSVVDDKTITKNELITIESNNAKMNCGTNLQCALNIIVNKNSESDKTYNLTINVLTGESTIPIPEVITPTENEVVKIIIPKGEKKMTTISVGKDEELEFKFDFSSGRGNILAVLLTKEEARDVNNLNFDENSSNLLGYDASGRILRLTKQDTEKCDAGCELVILMSVSDTEDEFTEVSISKTSISSENKEGQKEDDGNKVDAWLTAVLVVVCVVAVAGALILVYFLVLRKKKLTNMSSPPIEESEKEIKNNIDMVSKDKEKVINFNQ